MTKAADDEILEQTLDAIAKWKPHHVLRFNSSSWMNEISLLAGFGHLDCDYKVDVTPAHRSAAANLLRKALSAAAANRRVGSIFGPVVTRLFGDVDPIAYYKSLTPPPPQPQPKSGGVFHGSRVLYVQHEPESVRLLRYEILAALALEAYEKDHNWTPDEKGLKAMINWVGIR